MMSEKKRPGRTFILKTKVNEADVPKEVKQEHNIKSGRAALKKVVAATGLAKSLSRVGTMNSLNKKGDRSPSNLDMESPDFADDFAFAEVYGPQLRMNKTHLAFIEKIGNLSRDSISVTNNGTTAIYYKWRKIDQQTFFQAAIFDKEERFFCHANKNVIKPGEMKTFYFTFKSNCTGIFEEEWVLECEPPLLTPLPIVTLSGHSIEDDPNVEWRSEIDMITDAKHKHRFITEILNDVIGEVRTPTPPLPDLEDPVVCKREFEEKNAKYNLYYTPIVMNLYRHFQAMIYEELHLTPENTYWDLNVDFLVELINRVRENHVRENLERRWNDLLILAKKKPLDRHPTFDHVKKILDGMLKELPHVVNNIRKEREMMEINFSEPVDLSPEDLKKKQDEEAKAKAEFAKKQKKKPKNEEEERKMFEEYRAHVTGQIAQSIYQNVSSLEENDNMIRALHDLNTKKRPGQEYFEMLGMKKTIKDLDIEEKRILLRVHLKAANKIPLISPEEHAQIQAAKDAEREKAREEAKIAQLKAGVKESKKAKKTKEELAEELAKQREEEAKLEFIKNVDEKSLHEAVSVIKAFLEQSAKLVIVLVSFGEPNGKFNPNTTLKYFQEYLNGNIDDQTTYYFEDSVKVENFQEKIESDTYQPNSALILENIFHHPEEAGYIFDENNRLEKLDHYQIQEFANLLSSYAPVYVIEDKYNIFKDHASLSRVKTELTIFGPVLSNDLTLVAQAFLHCAYEPKKSTRTIKKQQQELIPKKKTLAIIGGDFSTELILALNTILNFYDEVYIMGKIGILFVMQKLGFKNFGTYHLDIHKQRLIESILNNAAELGTTIHIPEKLIAAPNPVEDQLPQWISSIYNTRFVWPDGYEQYMKDLQEKQAQQAAEEQAQKKVDPKAKADPKAAKADPKGAPVQKTLEEIPEEQTNGIKSLPKDFLVVGYEQSFVQEIEAAIYDARNILWIGSLDPIVRPGLIDSNQSVALTIYNVKEERKYKPLQNGIPTEWLVSVVGEDLLEAMNHFDIAFDAPPVKEKQGGDAMSEMEKSQHDEDGMSRIDAADTISKGTKIEKRNNVGLVADIHSTNTSFVLNLIAGKELETLNMITNYEKKAQDEEDEDFSFIDEI